MRKLNTTKMYISSLYFIPKYGINGCVRPHDFLFMLQFSKASSEKDAFEVLKKTVDILEESQLSMRYLYLRSVAEIAKDSETKTFFPWVFKNDPEFIAASK